VSDVKLAAWDELGTLLHSPVRNYVIPGLTSWLVASSQRGTIRLFSSERNHQQPIAPHSHRFDFTSVVLRGQVTNVTWVPVSAGGDLFQETTLKYDGDIGKYTRTPALQRRWEFSGTTYQAGESYTMQYHEVHSVHFSRGALLLIAEGPTVTDESTVLDPVVDGQVIPTSRVEDWMFQR
jgi:hypothetical protein